MNQISLGNKMLNKNNYRTIQNYLNILVIILTTMLFEFLRIEIKKID